MGDAELDPSHARMRSVGPAPWDTREEQDMGNAMDVDTEKGKCTSNTGAPENRQGRRPAAIPAPGSPPLSEKLPSPHGSPAKRPEWESSFGNKCEPSQTPVADRAQYDRLTRDQTHDRCRRRGFRERDSKAVLETRLTSMDAAEKKREKRGA